MATLDARLTELERAMLQLVRVALVLPDANGDYPEPPPGVVRVIRVEFIEGGPRHESELRAGG